MCTTAQTIFLKMSEYTAIFFRHIYNGMQVSDFLSLMSPLKGKNFFKWTALIKSKMLKNTMFMCRGPNPCSAFVYTCSTGVQNREYYSAQRFPIK